MNYTTFKERQAQREAERRQDLIATILASNVMHVVALSDPLPRGGYNDPQNNVGLNDSWEEGYLEAAELKCPFAICLREVDDMGMSLRGELVGINAETRPELELALTMVEYERLWGLFEFYVEPELQFREVEKQRRSRKAVKSCR